MKQPLVSILITSYNRDKYIAEAIKSALNSTYSNFEIIIVDDCSTDNTYKIAEAYALLDDRIKLYQNEQNLGQFENRNKAIRLSNGEYIKFLDSDDVIYPHSLSIMAEAMIANPTAGIGLPISGMFVHRNLPFLLSVHDSVWLHFNGSVHFHYGPSAGIFKRDTVIKSSFFESEYGILADALFNYKIACNSDTVFFSRDLFYWRIHDEQVTVEQKKYVQMVKERYRILQACLNYEFSPLSKEEKKRIAKPYKRINLIHFIKTLAKGKVKDAIDIYKGTDINLFFKS